MIAIAGASGFVGRGLLRELTKRGLPCVGLGRHAPAVDTTHNLAEPSASSWRVCDLFSLEEAVLALRGIDVAFYLVHSMLPSARLTQGDFRDFDLICADNFARAAAQNGVRQIIYLGGIVPPSSSASGVLSPHLASRLEVERTLSAHGVPVTALRAGLVVGRGGASFNILIKLVARLPAMICPAWTLTKTQPIALSDTVALLAFCLNRPATFGRVFDIGGRDILSYRDMMGRTAKRLGLHRRLLPLPLLTPRLSSLWVSLITGTPRGLVRPLIQSLRHEMITRDHVLLDMAGLPGLSFDQALDEAFNPRVSALGIHGEAVPAPAAVVSTGPAAAETPKPSSRKTPGKRAKASVRSVQRMALPQGMTSTSVANEYLTWLPKRLSPFLRVDIDPPLALSRGCRIRLSRLSRPLLDLEFEPNEARSDVTTLSIRGGLLVRTGTRGFLEFREVLDRRHVLTAIHEFYPRLPWLLYTSTQAVLHLLVMRAFARRLARYRN